MQNTVMADQTMGRTKKSSTVTRYSVSSVQSAIALLDAFLHPPHQFGLTELSRMTGQTKNQTFRLLQTLADDRVVTIDPETKRYSLGYRVLEWGVAAQRSSPLMKAVSPVMDRLANDIQETVVLTTLADEVSAICIDKRESSQALQISARVGRRIPLHAGAGSKCLLAHSTVGFIERFIEQASPLARFTARTITDPGHLRDELRHIQEQGYAVSDEDIDEGACSIAAPIRDNRGDVIAAVSIACPKTRFREADAARNKQAVTEAADDVSQQLRQYF
jgi:DNA-binding IclR family transcriptional regulator